MREIGVICGGGTAGTLNGLYAMSDGGVAVRRVTLGDTPRRFNVLVVNDAGVPAAGFLRLLEHGDAAIINADDKNLVASLGASRGRLITYGFSGKACVTASSVIDAPYECIQFCIQRALPTLSGGVLEPQEFQVCFKSPQNIHCALGAVTAAVICGMAAESLA